MTQKYYVCLSRKQRMELITFTALRVLLRQVYFTNWAPLESFIHPICQHSLVYKGIQLFEVRHVSKISISNGRRIYDI